MKMFRTVCMAILSVVLFGCSQPDRNEEVLFQASTINALLEGVYDGEITYGELKQHGDFGIGTFNGLDGEMIGLDGMFYQVKSDGVAYAVADSMKTPFAAVTFFEADKEVALDQSVDYEQLRHFLDQMLPTQNIFYAIKIEGTFTYIKTRSVPGQHKPYPPLVEVVKHQPTFEFHDVTGTMVGFRCPAYVKGVNVPGYHLHFITEDKKGGGHVLDCRIQDVTIGIDYTSGFYLTLPEASTFYETDLSKEKELELEQVEKEK